jgi:hypothetical protein
MESGEWKMVNCKGSMDLPRLPRLPAFHDSRIAIHRVSLARSLTRAALTVGSVVVLQ